jgi:hypothetical protein
MEFLDNGATCNTSLVNKGTLLPSSKEQNTIVYNHDVPKATVVLHLRKQTVAFETS